MKLLRSTKSNVTNKFRNFEIIEIVLIHSNIVNNDYHYDLRVLYTFVPNKLFVQLLNNSPENFIFSRTFNLEFSWIEDQNSKPLDIEDETNITLLIN